MSYLVNLIMDGRAAVVIGGGEVAARKVEDLLAAKASVMVIAPRVCDRISAFANQQRIETHLRPYRKEDLAGTFLAVAATDDEEVNARVAGDAVAMNILVNVVDCPALCTFTVPATIRRGDLALAITTEGRCPALAAILRRELEARYGSEYSELLDLFAKMRQEMIAQSWDSRRIRETLIKAYKDGIVELIAAGEPKALRDFLAAHRDSRP
jgi:precorrin-2 dehydrogenase/sirohydrochlorin ferrochelatase